jgi:fructokinase
MTAPAPVAVGIGELLWDLLPAGERLGGAPFNVVAHLHRFGWTSRYVTAVGDDPYGRRALAEATRLGVDTSLIQVNQLPTGVARARLEPAGEADYEIVSPAAYEALTPHHGANAAAGIDLITFGTLAQRFPGVRAATCQLATDAPDAVLLYDVNLRRNCWDSALVEHLLTLATVVKLNRDEQQVLAAELALPPDPIETFSHAASERYDLLGVCVTSGPSGAALLLDGTYAEAPTPTVQVIDTVGAGDAFAAALGKGVVESRPVAELLDVATRLGAHVASQTGAIPNWASSDI